MADAPLIAVLDCCTTEGLGSLGSDPDAQPLGERVILQVAICPVAAERLAEHKRSRAAAGADVLAPEAREVADPVLDALVAAGYGE